MRGLTLHRPWDEAFVLLRDPDLFERNFAKRKGRVLKRIENRSWAPPPWMIDAPLALHAGNHYDAEAANMLIDAGIPLVSRDESDAKRRERLFAVTVVRGFVDGDKQGTIEYLADINQLFWFSGPKAWLFDRPTPVENDIRCRGRQGLWNVPSHLLDGLPTPEGIAL